MTAYFATVAGLFGLLIGSFLNVVAYRVPLSRSVVSPPSACPECGHPIRWKDNIPVVSWLLLKGRCRDCDASISARYPFVEAATGALFVGSYLVIGPVWVLPAYLLFVATTVVLVLTDLDHKRIPNRILYPATAAAVMLIAAGAAADGSMVSIPRALAGGGIYFGLLLVIALLARGGFGMGDVKLAFLLGTFLAFQSWDTLWSGIFLAFLIGGVISLLLLITKRKGRKDAIPFGPPLIVGALVALVWGQQLVDWYLS
ncbi:MAG: prepilin peptidase [Acidimicrobiia bacterium]|nr:prepilin peptidase [Acidimicrobiia bacterium]MDH3397859.1 prepilin peptidase [Acidimicrobiia bacterium]